MDGGQKRGGGLVSERVGKRGTNEEENDPLKPEQPTDRPGQRSPMATFAFFFEKMRQFLPLPLSSPLLIAPFFPGKDIGERARKALLCFCIHCTNSTYGQCVFVFPPGSLFAP